MDRMIIAIIFYINTYPFDKIFTKELPNEFLFSYSNYSLYDSINIILKKLILKKLILIDDISSILTSTFIIINKLIIKGINIPINKQYKLITISIMLSSKLLDDDCYDNITWSNILNMDIEEINKMESIILKIIDYNVYISKKDYKISLKVLKNIPINRAINEISQKYKSRNLVLSNFKS